MLADCCECGHRISTNAKQCPNCGYDYRPLLSCHGYSSECVEDKPGRLRRMSAEEAMVHQFKITGEKEKLQKRKEEEEKAEKEKGAIREQNRREMAKGNGCFIATAAYGTPLAQEISLLRRFKDEHLARYRVGRTFVSTYYHLSPPVAEFIGRRPCLRAITRAVLRPIIWLLQK